MKKYILFIIFAMLCQGMLNAQTVTAHERLTREADYTIQFSDSTPSELLHVRCVYDDTKIDSCYSIYLNANKDDAKPDFTLNKQLSFDVFADKFAIGCKSNLKYPSSPNMITLYKVYQLIWSIKNASGDSPEAGILQFSRGLLVFELKNRNIKEPTYRKRRELADSKSDIAFDLKASTITLKDELEKQLRGYNEEIEKYIDAVNAIDTRLDTNMKLFCKTQELIETKIKDSIDKIEDIIDSIVYPSSLNQLYIGLDSFITNPSLIKKHEDLYEKIKSSIRTSSDSVNFQAKPFKKILASLKNNPGLDDKNYPNYNSIKKDLESLLKIRLSILGHDSSKISTTVDDIIYYCSNYNDFQQRQINVTKNWLNEIHEQIISMQKGVEKNDRHSEVLKNFTPDNFGSNFLKIYNTYQTYCDYYQGNSRDVLLKKKVDSLKSEMDFFHATYAQINKVELQFERGFIESVKVWLNMGSSEYIYENIFAIGFSSVSNYRRIANTKLFVRNGPTDDDGRYIYLSDVFRNYDNRLNNFTRDYSPADTSFTVIPSEIQEITLRKEKYIDLINAKAYIDLKGVDKNKPNGLVQIELCKRFNINTARLQAGTSRSDFGILNYLDLFGSLTKIEQNNRELVLRNANIRDVNNSLVSPSYATSLDFLRYENYNVGINLGLLLFDKPDYKFTTYLDFGLRYGHAIIADTVLIPTGGYIKPFAKQLEAHTITFQFPKISIEFFPESRITPRLSWQLNQTKLLSNNQYKQVASYEKSDVTSLPLEKRAGVSNQYEVFVKITPDKSRASNIFLRWRLYTQFGDANTSFSQMQVGYTFNWTTAR